MALNKIKNNASWGESASSLNSNFESIEADLTKVKNATTRCKGYFISGDELKTAYPSAHVGDYAYIGTAYPFYIWKWNGSSWGNTGNTGGDQDVNLENYYNKTETDAKLSELGSKANFSNSTVISGVIKDSHSKVGEANVFVKAGTKLKVAYNFSSLSGQGWRLYENITGGNALAEGGPTDLNGTKFVTTTNDVTKFILYTTSNVVGECAVYIEESINDELGTINKKLDDFIEKTKDKPIYSNAALLKGELNTAYRQLIEVPVFIKKGTKLAFSYKFSSLNYGWRLYANEVVPSKPFISGTPSMLDGTVYVTTSEDITKLILWAQGAEENGEAEVYVSTGEYEDLSNHIDNLSALLFGSTRIFKFRQPITASRKEIGSFDVAIGEGDVFTLLIERNYTSLTGGRVYDESLNSLSNLTAPSITITAVKNITKLRFYDDSETEGELTVTIEVKRRYATIKDVDNIKSSLESVDNDLYGGYYSKEFEQPIASIRKYIGEIDTNIKEGDTFNIIVNRDYESITGGRVYQNAAPDLLATMPNGIQTQIASKDINKLIFWDDSNTEGTLSIKIEVVSKFATKKELEALKEKVEDKENPYKGLYGTVIGDSHAVRRASWVPVVYNRLGVSYDSEVASFVVGAGNSCGEGYEDCIDPVFAQAKRSVESYNNGNKIDFILLDNVHYVYESDIKPVIPFKTNQIIDLGKMEGSSSQEKNWFSENFSSLISNVEQKLGTTLKSTWARKKYDLTFSGTPVAGTSFSIIIDGKTYDTPINEGDTLNTFAERVATWVFGEEWTSTSKNNIVTITYNGSSSAPSLSISYEDNESGITMVSTEGEVESSVYRYYQRKDLVDWNNVSAWGVVSGWFAGGLKGAVEYLLENIPTVKIVIISLPYYPIKKNDFLTELGQDQEAFLNSSTYTSNRKRVTLMKNIAEYYNLPFVDFEKDAYISLSNYFNYFPENDVHPYKIGYERLADCICTKLGF